MSNIYPNSPTVGEQVTVNGTVKEWNGSAWINITNGNHEQRLRVSESVEFTSSFRAAGPSELEFGLPRPAVFFPWQGFSSWR